MLRAGLHICNFGREVIQNPYEISPHANSFYQIDRMRLTANSEC